MQKVKNFQEEFTREDIEIVRDVKDTYDCGLSRIVLKAPKQRYLTRHSLMKEPESSSATVCQMTLKLHYAIQVWIKAALISLYDKGDLTNYWRLDWEEGEGAFNELKYREFNRDITVEELLQRFWDLLKEIADSQEIKVAEGYYIRNEGVGYSWPKIVCDIVIDTDDARDIHIDNIYEYPYNKEPKSYSWDDIKDMFCELTLNQLRLTMPDNLHRHNEQDDILLKACSDWDIEQIKLSLKNGAYVNCLDKMGYSVLQQAVESFKEHDMWTHTHYTKEETEAIEAKNLIKCKEVVELLLANGADINLYGYNGLAPIVCAFYSRSPEMTRFLLEKGADPNVNCYLEDIEYWPRLKNVRSTVLEVIDDLIYEDYNEVEKEIEIIVRDAGGRQFVWDFTPWNYENTGKYVVVMHPSSTNTNLFSDNSRWWIGSESSLTIEDKDGRQTKIELKQIDGLHEWCQEYRDNCENPSYKWDTWIKRGLELAKKVADAVPDSVALFYLDKDAKENEYIRIK